MTGPAEGRRRWSLADRLTAGALGPQLRGRRVLLRPLMAGDFPEWQEVRDRKSVV